MPLNRDYVGRRYPPTEPYHVGREHVHYFARAIGDANPYCHDPEVARAAGYPDVVAPPTFLTALSFRRPNEALADPGLGLDYSRVVHGEQRFVLHRPVVAGDDLVATPTITDIRDAGRNELLTVELDIATTAGEPVATAAQTIISRGTAASKEG